MEISQEQLTRQKEEWDWLMASLEQMVELVHAIQSDNPAIQLAEEQESELRSAEKARYRRSWILPE